MVGGKASLLDEKVVRWGWGGGVLEFYKPHVLASLSCPDMTFRQIRLGLEMSFWVRQANLNLDSFLSVQVLSIAST